MSKKRKLPKQRDHMDDDEADLFETASNEFAQELARITAMQLKKFPPELEQYVRMRLQEHTSLFAPYTAKWIDHWMEHFGGDV